jgi:hypothetical protein
LKWLKTYTSLAAISVITMVGGAARFLVQDPPPSVTATVYRGDGIGSSDTQENYLITAAWLA